MDRITNSDTHFKPLVANGKESLKQLGFSLNSENDQKATFTNSEGIVIDIVYQRYDPPEVWIGNIDFKDRVRIDFHTEKYFNQTAEIFRKYSNDQVEFDYSSFDYYHEFLILFKTKIEAPESIARVINAWMKGE